MTRNQYVITVTVTEVSDGHISVSCCDKSTFPSTVEEPAYSVIALLTNDVRESVQDAVHILATLVGGEITHSQSVQPPEDIDDPPVQHRPRFDFGSN